MNAARDLQVLADLAEVECPHTDSCGAAFLFAIEEDCAHRLEELAVRFHADELASIAQTSLNMPDPNLWQVFADLRAWEEDVTGTVPKEADMTWQAEAALEAIGLRLASALVSQALASRCEFVV